MIRFLRRIASISITGVLAAYPLRSLAGIMTMGVGIIAAAGGFTPPTIVPQPSVFFDNQNDGVVNNALAVPANSFQFPSIPTQSIVVYIEGEVSPGLGFNGSNEYDYLLGSTTNSTAAFGSGLYIPGNSFGTPTWRLQSAQNTQNWWSGTNTIGVNGVTTTGQNGGYYGWSATGGCQRPPTGTDFSGGIGLSDPGFLCGGSTSTVDMTTLVGLGQKQATGAGSVTTTCVSHSPISGEMTVTAHVANAHGYVGGQTYTLAGFTPSGYNATYTALAGTSGTTLVGETTTGAGTCPAAVSVEGTAFSGTGSAPTFTYNATNTPFVQGGTGITTKDNDHFCAVIGEYGSDSSYPGAQFASFVDGSGNPLPGAPALVPWLNQGTANFTGYVATGAQPELNVTAMNPYTITNAVYSGGNVTFTTSTSPGFVVGSEFTVTGVTPSGYNQTYVAITGTSGTTIVGSPLTGPLGTLLSLSNPGTFVNTGVPQLVSVIMPDMVPLGVNAAIDPYGTSGATGTGGTGTYTLTGNVGSATFNIAAMSSTTVMNVTSNPSGGSILVPGDAISGSGITPGTIITAYGTATGTTGTYILNNSQTVGAITATSAGTVWSSGSPGTIFAAPLYYQTAAGDNTNPPAIGKVTARTQAAIGNLWATIGSLNTNITVGTARKNWSGTIANASMLWGVFPQDSTGAPSTTALASLCKKTTDLKTFASANSLTVHSLYALNDPGIFGDHSIADFTGSITGASGTTGTLNVSSTQSGTLTGSGTATLSGVGIAGCPTACPTFPLGAGPTYTVTWGSSIAANVSSEAMAAGNFKPATPTATGLVTGYTDLAGGVPTLHVTDFPAGTQTAKFNASLGNTVTGSISGTTLTITAPTTGAMQVGVGTTLTNAASTISAGTKILAQLTTTATNSAPGLSGTYTVNNSQTVGSGTILAGSPLPSPANHLLINSTASGTVTQYMMVTDGGVNITGLPLQITGTSNPFTIIGTYYPTFLNDSTMVGTLTTLIPGQYVLNSSISTPVKITAYQGACGITGAVNYGGGLGCYTLSNSTNGSIGTALSPVTFSLTGLTDGAPPPTPALTIDDLGPGITYPVNNYSTGTGTLALTGTYDTSVLGGTPSIIQAQVSLTEGGPPVSGCSACAWTNLSSYTSTLVSGTKFKWSGQALNIPAQFGPLFVSVRAANGTAYASLQNYIKVGTIFDIYGEGPWGAVQAAQGGIDFPSFSGMFGMNRPAGNSNFTVGPPVIGNARPGFTPMVAANRYVLDGSLTTLYPEGTDYFSQDMVTAFGWPNTINSMPLDSIGLSPHVPGEQLQTQTVGVGDGSTTTWCSTSIYCSNVSVSGPMTFTSATRTGAGFTGSVSGTTLTVSAMQQGGLEPNQILSGAGISGSPTLVACTSGCTNPVVGGTLSTWTLSASLGTIGSESMRADVSGGSVWSLSGPWTGLNPFAEPGTFSISVNGTVVCQDTATFAYNIEGSTCTGAGVTSSFVNYLTGAYSVVFATPPASGAAITASWTSDSTFDCGASTCASTARPPMYDFFGKGDPSTGTWSNLMSNAPGGVSGHVFANAISDNAGFRTNGYANSPGYSQVIAWFYGTRFLAFPGEVASTPIFVGSAYRADGAVSLTTDVTNTGAASLYYQWSADAVVQSRFTGTIVASTSTTGVLTLTASTTDPMWEGEMIGCNPPNSTCAAGLGTFITGLASGTWGASGSTYNLVSQNLSNVSSPLSMLNAAYIGAYGTAPAYPAGEYHDTPVQEPTEFVGAGLAAHVINGYSGGGRIGRRMAAEIWGALSASPPNAKEPSLDRVKADAVGCDTGATVSPCFDIGTTYQASATGTISGNTITITGGLSAHARPFVDGQVISCTGCTAGRVIQSLSVPPTQDTRSGQGEVGQTFVITANGSLGTTGSKTVTAGCSGTSGTGSNCIDIAFSINTPGTYGTTASLASCGENNLQGNTLGGNSPNGNPPNGTCQTNGVGTLTRSFRIGTQQFPYGGQTPNGLGATGALMDDGADAFGYEFNQSGAFTCNVVAAKVVQCVKAPSYTSGVATGVGQWASGSTYISYGNATIDTSRSGGMMGNVGGESFGFTAGSGYTNGTQTITGSCTLSSGTQPKIDVTVAGGSIINVYGSTALNAGGLAIQGGQSCTWNLAPLGAGTGGAITAMTQAPPIAGRYGVLTNSGAMEMMGDILYDNSGLSGNPLNQFFACPISSGYCEPGLPVTPFGQFAGVGVSG